MNLEIVWGQINVAEVYIRIIHDVLTNKIQLNLQSLKNYSIQNPKSVKDQVSAILRQIQESKIQGEITQRCENALGISKVQPLDADGGMEIESQQENLQGPLEKHTQNKQMVKFTKPVNESEFQEKEFIYEQLKKKGIYLPPIQHNSINYFTLKAHKWSEFQYLLISENNNHVLDTYKLTYSHELTFLYIQQVLKDRILPFQVSPGYDYMLLFCVQFDKENTYELYQKKQVYIEDKLLEEIVQYSWLQKFVQELQAQGINDIEKAYLKNSFQILLESLQNKWNDFTKDPIQFQTIWIQFDDFAIDQIDQFLKKYNKNASLEDNIKAIVDLDANTMIKKIVGDSFDDYKAYFNLQQEQQMQTYSLDIIFQILSNKEANIAQRIQLFETMNQKSQFNYDFMSELIQRLLNNQVDAVIINKMSEFQQSAPSIYEKSARKWLDELKQLCLQTQSKVSEKNSLQIQKELDIISNAVNKIKSQTQHSQFIERANQLTNSINNLIKKHIIQIIQERQTCDLFQEEMMEMQKDNDSMQSQASGKLKEVNYKQLQTLLKEQKTTQPQKQEEKSIFKTKKLD